MNRQVGTQTGTIQMAAEFPNPDAMLRPGGFGRVRIQTGTNKNALLVPQAAVMQVQSMYQLIVVTPENKASFRPVKVGERVGTNWIITEGLKPGEKGVVEGSEVQQFAARPEWQGRYSRRRQAVCACQPQRQGATDHVEIFHQSAHCRHRHFHPDGAGRRGGDAQPADGAVSQHRRPA